MNNNLHNHPTVKKAQELYEKHGYEALSRCCGAEKKYHPSQPLKKNKIVCSKCSSPFIPQSTEKECKHGFIVCGICDVKSPTESSWMEEEREAFMLWLRNPATDPYPINEKFTDYWLTRLAEKIEAARKEGMKMIETSELDRIQKNAIEQGRTEEREKTFELLKKQAERSKKAGRIEERDRIVKMIKSKKENNFSFNTAYDIVTAREGKSYQIGREATLEELLANIKSNE